MEGIRNLNKWLGNIEKIVSKGNKKVSSKWQLFVNRMLNINFSQVLVM